MIVGFTAGMVELNGGVTGLDRQLINERLVGAQSCGRNEVLSAFVQCKRLAHVSRVWLHVGFDSAKLASINANVQIISGAVAVHALCHVFVSNHMRVWRATHARVIGKCDTATNVVRMSVGVNQA